MEADQLKSVERRNRLADGIRRENTAEHSWHLGIAALVLAPFASEPVDVGTAVAMALVHDIVEIDAGDTFAYDDAEERPRSRPARKPPPTGCSACCPPRPGGGSARCGTSTNAATPPRRGS